MGPESWLLRSYKIYKLVRLPSEGGIEPETLFVSRFRFSSNFKFPSFCGTGPINWLLNRWSQVRLLMFPKLDEIEPNRRLLLKLISTRLVRFPISGGMVLESLFVYRYK